MLLFDQVQKLPFHDHNAPPLCVLVEFCRHAKSWLNEKSDNIVTVCPKLPRSEHVCCLACAHSCWLDLNFWFLQVHCQGGKGRSGTFCSALLLWTGYGHSAAEVLDIFAQRRMDERIKSNHYQGVSAPSQIRYVNYIEQIVRNQVDYTAAAKRLVSSVKIRTMPYYRRNKISVSFIIESLGTIQYDHAKRHRLEVLSRGSNVDRDHDEYKFETEGTLVSGDVVIRFYCFDEKSSSSYEFAELGPGARTIKYGAAIGKELCFVSFHTAFHTASSIDFTRPQIDGVYDASTHDFLEQFSISVEFEEFDVSTTHKTRLLSPTSSQQFLSSENKPISEKSALSDDAAGCCSAMHSAHIEHGLSVPYGCPPGFRFLRLHSLVKETLLGEPFQSRRFRKGQIMYNPMEKTYDRCLYMIVSGSAEYDDLPVSGEECSHPWQINRGDSIRGLSLAVGDFYGELPFLLGTDGDSNSFCIRATSDFVQVRFHPYQICFMSDLDQHAILIHFSNRFA